MANAAPIASTAARFRPFLANTAAAAADAQREPSSVTALNKASAAGPLAVLIARNHLRSRRRQDSREDNPATPSAAPMAPRPVHNRLVPSTSGSL